MLLGAAAERRDAAGALGLRHCGFKPAGSSSTGSWPPREREAGAIFGGGGGIICRADSSEGFPFVPPGSRSGAMLAGEAFRALLRP